MEPRWYWLDDSAQWIEYGKQSNNPAATVTSAQVEKAFQADQEGTLRFQVHSQRYEINFKGMIQRNLHTQTARRICRQSHDTSSGDGSQQEESTDKRWYWLDESNQWIEYGEESPDHCAATVTSAEVEKAFQADQKGTLRFRAGSQRYEINFKDMVQRNLLTQQVRRICRWPPDASDGDGNQQRESTGQRWYWLDDSNQWVEYGDESPNHCAATITSAEVEKAFQADQKGTLRFQAGSQGYEINFKDMLQRNLHTQMTRQICRWPDSASDRDIQQKKSCCWYWLNGHRWVEYGKQHSDQCAAPVSSAEVELLFQAHQEGSCEFIVDSQKYKFDFKEMVQRNPNTQTVTKICRSPSAEVSGSSEQDKKRQSDAIHTHHLFPSDWDHSALPETGYELVEVSRTASKYREIENLFQRTMKHYRIHRLRRIQNPMLWQYFQLQKEQMKKRSPGQEVDERLLFHGTSSSHLSAICEQNFDWRVCGAHGTLYGKGSYFARDASYSHQYCSSGTGHQSMFVAHVLVGDFVQGHRSFLRPPPRPGNVNRLYDSCVDDPGDPSIFVIFEKHQIYPAYILEYTRSSQ
ncbi:protein mono-ADP-ribosyltransferase PARP12-like isoform X2 [Rhea pennata]|uniref:protein mono-ADP-ribosyltransferase PARP12-like isoform X2 n=1 Tax=Rhea pennata TaxID=8795 RepID=UPI002E25C578